MQGIRDVKGVAPLLMGGLMGISALIVLKKEWVEQPEWPPKWWRQRQRKLERAKWLPVGGAMMAGATAAGFFLWKKLRSAPQG